jgi:hypothetical protein
VSNLIASNPVNGNYVQQRTGSVSGGCKGRRYMRVTVVLMLLASCSDRRPPQACPTVTEIKIGRSLCPLPPEGPAWPAEVVNLLRIRRKQQTDRLDDAIRFLARAGCGFDQNAPASWVDTASVDELFSLDRLDDAFVAIGCGQLILKDHTATCGALPLRNGSCRPMGLKPHESKP